MFCRSCGNELSDSASFCPHCGSEITPPAQRNAQIAHEATPDDSPAGVQLQNPPGGTYAIPSASTAGQSSNHPYKKLGGFLAFIVYASYISAVLMVISQVASIAQLAMLSSQYGAYGSTIIGAAMGPLVVLLIVYVAIAAFICWWATQIKNRNPSFLKIYHYLGVVGLAIELIAMIVTGNPIAGLLYLVLGALSIFLWTLYFVKSVRVRTYFGNDEYLRQSPFTKSMQAPNPAVPD